MEERVIMLQIFPQGTSVIVKVERIMQKNPIRRGTTSKMDLISLDWSLYVVVRRIMTALELEEDWLLTIFQTCVQLEENVRNLIVDSGNITNMASQSKMDHLEIPREKHPHLYKIAWVNDKFYPSD